MCSERAKASLDSNSSDEDDLWEDRDINFAHSSIAQQKKPLSFGPAFSDGTSTSLNATGDATMDIDQNDCT